MKSVVKKEINKYLERIVTATDDQERANAWMLAVTAVGILKELETIDNIVQDRHLMSTD